MDAFDFVSKPARPDAGRVMVTESIARSFSDGPGAWVEVRDGRRGNIAGAWLTEPDTRALCHALADFLGLVVTDPFVEDVEEEPAPAPTLNVGKAAAPAPAFRPGDGVRITRSPYRAPGADNGSTGTVLDPHPRASAYYVRVLLDGPHPDVVGDSDGALLFAPSELEPLTPEPLPVGTRVRLLADPYPVSRKGGALRGVVLAHRYDDDGVFYGYGVAGEGWIIPRPFSHVGWTFETAEVEPLDEPLAEWERALLFDPAEEPEPSPTHAPAPFAVGDRVEVVQSVYRHRALAPGARGVVREVRDDLVRVRADGLPSLPGFYFYPSELKKETP